ncbi:hypothetical protein ACFLTB_05480 [Chloroflexota bacterium]
MQWELVVLLIIAIPIMIFPAAYIWYLNIGGIYLLIKEARAKRAAKRKETYEYLKSLDAKREKTP